MSEFFWYFYSLSSMTEIASKNNDFLIGGIISYKKHAGRKVFTTKKGYHKPYFLNKNVNQLSIFGKIDFSLTLSVFI
jgi:hypothetical protein